MPRSPFPLALSTAAAFLLAAAPAPAQMMKSPDAAPSKAVPQGRSEVQLSFAPVVKRAAPSVVNVYASHVVEKRSNARASAMEEFMRRFFGEDGRGRVGPGGMPGERAQKSLCS